MAPPFLRLSYGVTLSSIRGQAPDLQAEIARQVKIQSSQQLAKVIFQINKKPLTLDHVPKDAKFNAGSVEDTIIWMDFYARQNNLRLACIQCGFEWYNNRRARPVHPTDWEMVESKDFGQYDEAGMRVPWVGPVLCFRNIPVLVNPFLCPNEFFPVFYPGRL